MEIWSLRNAIGSTETLWNMSRFTTSTLLFFIVLWYNSIMNEKRFGVMPINKLFFKPATPGVIAMVFASMGMMIDGIFVGHFIGSEALAAINLVIPIAMIFFAAFDMIAVGSQVKISIMLGEGNERSANELFTASVLITFALGLIVMILGFIYLEDAVFFVIRDEKLAQLAYAYTNVLIIFIPIVGLFFAIDNYLKVCGKAHFSMALSIGAAFSNSEQNYTTEFLNYSDYIAWLQSQSPSYAWDY